MAAVLIIKVFKGADLTYLTFIHAKTGAVQLFAKTVTCAMTVIPSYHRSMAKILDSTLHFPFNSECRVPEKERSFAVLYMKWLEISHSVPMLRCGVTLYHNCGSVNNTI